MAEVANTQSDLQKAPQVASTTTGNTRDEKTVDNKQGQIN